MDCVRGCLFVAPGIPVKITHGKDEPETVGDTLLELVASFGCGLRRPSSEVPGKSASCRAPRGDSSTPAWVHLDEGPHAASVDQRDELDEDPPVHGCVRWTAASPADGATAATVQSQTNLPAPLGAMCGTCLRPIPRRHHQICALHTPQPGGSASHTCEPRRIVPESNHSLCGTQFSTSGRVLVSGTHSLVPSAFRRFRFFSTHHHETNRGRTMRVVRPRSLLTEALPHGTECAL